MMYDTIRREAAMQEVLGILEKKVRALVEERAVYLAERDLLAVKVMELEDVTQALKDEMQTLKIRIKELEATQDGAQQEAVITSMVVEEMISLIDEKQAA